MPELSTEVRRSLRQLQERLHGLLDRFRPGHRDTEGDEEVGGGLLAPRPVFSGPALDVEETDDTILVRAELPGLKAEDFTVESTADRVIIRGEKSEEREEQGRGFYRRERRAGAFVRSVALPCEVNSDRAEAQYRDGVLRLRLPKTERAKSRQVRIKVAGG